MKELKNDTEEIKTKIMVLGKYEKQLKLLTHEWAKENFRENIKRLKSEIIQLRKQND